MVNNWYKYDCITEKFWPQKKKSLNLFLFSRNDVCFLVYRNLNLVEDLVALHKKDKTVLTLVKSEKIFDDSPILIT